MQFDCKNLWQHSDNGNETRHAKGHCEYSDNDNDNDSAAQLISSQSLAVTKRANSETESESETRQSAETRGEGCPFTATGERW